MIPINDCVSKYFLVFSSVTLGTIYYVKLFISDAGIARARFYKSGLGFALSAVSIAYGFSKFFMGTVSDRSNARIFLVLGLVLTAIVNLLMGFVPFFTSGIGIMFVLLFLNGWFQGMGWPPSGRVLVHWFSVSERGSKTALWNVAHNVGGGIMALLLLGYYNNSIYQLWLFKGFEGVFI